QERAFALQVHAPAVNRDREVNVLAPARLTADQLHHHFQPLRARTQDRIRALSLRVVHPRAQSHRLRFVSSPLVYEPAVQRTAGDDDQHDCPQQAGVLAAKLGEGRLGRDRRLAWDEPPDRRVVREIGRCHRAAMLSTSSNGTPEGSLRPARTRAVTVIAVSGSMRLAWSTNEGGSARYRSEFS